MNRRQFLRSAAALALASQARAGRKPKLKKAVKYGMIGAGATPWEKFELIKRIGFDGVEMDSPDSTLDKAEVVAARNATGIVIHGVVDSTHWTVRHSDPRQEVRNQALKDLQTALRDAKTYGADTVLLVPGAVRDAKSENYDRVWERSTEQVKKAIPLAKELGVRIAIETVWNNFITTPEQLVKYVDQFDTPMVGAYLDCGNVVKYGVPPAEWVRRLGRRLQKLDVKAYSKARAAEKKKEYAGFEVGIGDGDEDWPEVLKALDEVGYTGWATAEVGSGGEAHLRDVAARMNRVLGL
jgi:hexulose-6-phosphate isomerase